MIQKLEQILRKSLLIPLSIEQMEGVDKVCAEYVKEMNFALADEMIGVFVSDKEDNNLEKNFLSKVVVELPNTGDVPIIIFRACCMYIIWLAVQSDELDEELKAGISLMVKNAMLPIKDRLQELPCPEVMTDFYNVWNNFVTSEIPKTDTAASMQMAKDVLTEASFFQSHSIGKEMGDIIRQWAYDSVSTTINAWFEGKRAEFEDEEDLTRRMTTAIIDWIENLPKVKLDTDGLKKIISLFDKNEMDMEFTVSQLLNVLRTYELPVEEDDVLESSILINALDNEKIAEDIGGLKLSLLEYGIYLYYELVVENLEKE